jgi:hypothetical protein
MLAMFLIMAFVSGCTFTGKSNERITPLTDDELSYFNGDEFFNGEYMNICNQFLSSIYDAPGKVDLFQLFYCGSGIEDAITVAEKSAVVAYNSWDMEPDCACTKISRSNMDAILSKYIGLTLSDTEKVGLEDFTYLEEYDAYYYYHGDTNYRANITFSGGEWEGDIIRLFYDDVFFGDGEKVLTLREKDDIYIFVSNEYSEAPKEANTKADVTLYQRSGVTIAIPNEYADQLLVDPIENDDESTLIYVYQKSTYEKYKGMGWLFSIACYTEAQYEQFLCSDGSGQSFFAKDGNYYYGFFHATDVQAPEDYEVFSQLFSAVGSFVKSDMISRNGLTPYSDNEFFNRTYTYDSDHIFISYYPYYAYNGSKEEVWTLILSQPVAQRNTGIWCVERWKDQYGNIYPYFPDENGTPSGEYYTALQAECDAGKDTTWLEPKQAALVFVKRVFDHSPATLDSFTLSGDPAAHFDLFAASTGDIHDYMPKLLAGETVSDYELLPCLENFTRTTWLELDKTYGSEWWNPLWLALRDAAVSGTGADSDDQSLRNYYMGKAYLTSDGAYSEGLSDILKLQWDYDRALYSACLKDRFSEDEAVLLRKAIIYSLSYSESIFSLTIPENGTLFLDVYPVDFPFTFDLTEKSRKDFKAESFGKVMVVEGDDLQVTYLNNDEGVYAIITIRTVKEGYSTGGIAIGSPEKALLESRSDKPLKKIDSISYDDEAWFGDDYDYAYANTPEESTKSLVFLIKDGLVSGIEIINGLDGAMY